MFLHLLPTKDETSETIVRKDLTSLLDFVTTLEILEINGANFAPILFQPIRDRKNFLIFFFIRCVERGDVWPKTGIFIQKHFIADI